MSTIKEKIKPILNDSLWSIVGLVIMNCCAQFIVYPFWNNVFGVDKYGIIIYFISMINIVATTLGISCGYARIKLSSERITNNSEFLPILVASGFICVVYVVIISIVNSSDLTVYDSVTYVILCCLILLRYYADVEYKLNINFKGYFRYYLLIGLGYLLGTYLMTITRIWPIALIPGEVAGLSYVFIRGSIFKYDGKASKEKLKSTFRVFLILLSSNFFEQFVFNADRLLIKLAISNTAVSSFYLSTLLGKTLSLVTTPFNGVIAGHLAKYKGKLSLKMMNALSALCILAAFIFAFICTVGSYILLPILYPDSFDLVRGFCFIGNLTQTIFFIANIVAVIMLRFAPIKNQVYIGIVYTVSFLAICVPLTIIGGMNGFYIGLLLSSLTRLLFALGIGYVQVFKQKNRTAS